MESNIELVELQDVPTGSGPDELAPADSYTSFQADQAVKIRYGENQASKRKPISIVTAFRKTVANHGDAIALSHKVNGNWVSFNYKEYYSFTIKMAKVFIKLGLEPHHGVGIIGFNSPEWFIANMAAIFAGGLATGIYTTNSPEACLFVANNAKCNIIVVENDQQLQKFLKVRDQLSDVKAIIQYKGKLENVVDGVYLWEDLIVSENDTIDEDLESRISNLAPNKCCTLIYTSGTTGNPKGVMLSHDNLIWSATSLTIQSRCRDNEVGVSYLPLSHIAAQLLDMYCTLVLGSAVYFAQPDALKGTLRKTLMEVRPTVFMGVPRVWEKMHESMTSIGKQSGYLKRSIASWARSIGSKNAYTHMDGVARGCMFNVADKLVFQKVKHALGLDRCRLMYSGAAPIMRETVDYFFSLNMPLLEAYGMSECTGIHTICFDDDYYIGSVGKNYAGLENKLDGDHGNGSGEICMRGRHVFMGYLNEESKTEECFDDEGWLHSGDVGTISDKGFLFITGRIKELIITSGGENIPPILVEDKVRELLPCVSNCMLIGDKKKFLSILITMKCDVNLDTMEPTDKLSKPCLDWLKSIGSSSKLVSDLTNHKDAKVEKAIKEGIAKVNAQATSRAQCIQKFSIVPKDFSIPGGELGPTLKLKRPFVLNKYGDIIDKFYEDADNGS